MIAWSYLLGRLTVGPTIHSRQIHPPQVHSLLLVINPTHRNRHTVTVTVPVVGRSLHEVVVTDSIVRQLTLVGMSYGCRLAWDGFGLCTKSPTTGNN